MFLSSEAQNMYKNLDISCQKHVYKEKNHETFF